MKSVALLILFIFVSFIAMPQDTAVMEQNSLLMESRIKADRVLGQFKKVHPKDVLLYSTLDKSYYVLIKANNQYQEYYITTNKNGKIIKKRLVKKSLDIHKEIEKLNPFSLLTCKLDSTNKKSACIYICSQSYFVLQNKKGERVVELSLPVLDSVKDSVVGNIYRFAIVRHAQIVNSNISLFGKLRVFLFHNNTK